MVEAMKLKKIRASWSLEWCLPSYQILWKSTKWIKSR